MSAFEDDVKMAAVAWVEGDLDEVRLWLRQIAFTEHEIKYLIFLRQVYQRERRECCREP